MPSAKDEIARRSTARRDPRAEPDSVPAMRAVKPEEEPAARESSPVLRDEVAPSVRRDPRADPEPHYESSSIRAKAVAASPEADIDVELPADPPAAEAPSSSASAPLDPRLAALEPLFGRTAWKEIADKLGPPEQAAALPPQLALIYALARREAAGEAGAAGANELAIRSMAALFGVAPTSATALVLAKRLLRQNPAGWRTRPAPPARLSLVIILLGVALGVAAGSFLSLETFHSLKFHLF
jgi:hypothetical protein